VKNIERFTQNKILPTKPEIYYYGSGIVSPERYIFDQTGYENQYTLAISGFNKDIAYQMIQARLDNRIQI